MQMECKYRISLMYASDQTTPNILANTYVLGIIDGTYVGMCEDTGTIYGYWITVSLM